MTREPVIRSEGRFLIFKKHEVANHRSRVIVWDPSKLKEIPGHKDHGGLQLALNNNLGSFKSKLHHAIEKNEKNQLKEKFLHSKGYKLFDVFTFRGPVRTVRTVRSSPVDQR